MHCISLTIITTKLPVLYVSLGTLLASTALLICAWVSAKQRTAAVQCGLNLLFLTFQLT
jgi:hypothetical protein